MPEYGKTDWTKHDGWQLTLLTQLEPSEGSNGFTGADTICSKPRMTTHVTIIHG